VAPVRSLWIRPWSFPLLRFPPVIWCHVFHSRVFHPYLVPRFPLLHFPPPSSGATFSTPAFSTLATWWRVFHSRIFHSRVFSAPADSSAQALPRKLFSRNILRLDVAAPSYTVQRTSLRWNVIATVTRVTDEVTSVTATDILPTDAVNYNEMHVTVNKTEKYVIYIYQRWHGCRHEM